MMEVPPGRVERISDGGEEAIRAILAELRAMKFNGLLKTSVFRGDTPSQGVLVHREEELYKRKWELEQEYQRSGVRQKELESLRAELQAVKEASGMIMRRLEERRTAEDVEIQSQRKVLTMESEKARAELEIQR